MTVRAARNDGENDVGIWVGGAPLLGHVRSHVSEHGVCSCDIAWEVSWRSLSASYQATKDLTARAGIINLTDKMPSYPTLSYGDILGRRYFLGVNLHL